ncbi:hypothetical protein MO973_19665 [Paenibacillus sp. TRM 82003]|nr:hypothetical protein [Paenibacillus sp. TRM 82003]
MVIHVIEIKKRICLQHIDSGMFLSSVPENMPHTSKVGQARKWVDEDQLEVWLGASSYAPENPSEYRIRRLRITTQLETEEDGNDGAAENEPLSKD